MGDQIGPLDEGVRWTLKPLDIEVEVPGGKIKAETGEYQLVSQPDYQWKQQPHYDLSQFGVSPVSTQEIIDKPHYHNQSIESTVSTRKVVDKLLAKKRYNNLEDVSIDYYEEIWGRFARSFPKWPESPEPIEEYLSQFAPANRLNHYNILKMLFTYGANTGLPNPFTHIEKPRVKDKPKPTLYPEDAKKVEESLVDENERGVFNLGYGMGWRKSEIVRARFADIGTDTMMVHGKKRDETVALLPEIREILLSLRNGRSLDDPIFCGQRGPLNKAGIYQLVKKMLRRVSIKGSPHMLRRGYGTALALQGCDAHTLMRLMRHRSIDEAIPYINMTDQHLAQRQKEFSPLRLAKTGNKKPLLLPQRPCAEICV